jgi:hypothetical protein
MGDDLQPHRAVEDERRQACGLLAGVGEGEVGQVLEQRCQDDFRLQTGEVRAEAEVRPVPEREVLVAGPRGVEAF